MLIFPTGFFSKPGFYYINIAKNAPKSMFLGKLPFGGEKMHFTQKQKLFQKLWGLVKMDKKMKFSKKNLSGVLGVHEYGYFGLFCQFWDPTDPPQNNIFWKLFFIICFTIAQSFWNNFCFGVNAFFTPKRQFFQKHGFWRIFWQYLYNKSPVY